MPVDTSSYGQYTPPPIGSTLGGLANAANAINQNKLFPLQQQQQQNETAISGQQLQQQQNATVGSGVALNKAQLDLQAQKLNTTLGYVSQLAAKGQNVKPSDLAAALGDANTIGHIDMPTTMQIWQSAPTGPDATNPIPDPTDPTGTKVTTPLAAWIQQMQFRIQDAKTQFEAQHPMPTPIQTGQGTQLVSNPQIGAPSVTGSVQNQPGPTTQVYDPVSGGMKFVGQQGNLPPGTPASAPIGTVEKVAANQSAYQNLQAQAENTTNNLNMLNNIKKHLSGATTGRGTAYVNDVKGFIKSQAPWVLSAVKALGGNVDPDTVTDYDAANKWMTQYAQAMAGAHGGHTDYQQATTAAGNANTHIDPKAAAEMVDNAIGLERMARAKVAQYKADNPDDPRGTNYLDWAASKWAPQADVRGATLDLGDKNANMKAIAPLKQSNPAQYAAILKTAIAVKRAEAQAAK